MSLPLHNIPYIFITILRLKVVYRTLKILHLKIVANLSFKNIWRNDKLNCCNL